jgi:hypothetical protein
MSSDSTTHKSINYVSKHIIFITKDEPNTRRTLALPITTIDNHSSSTQLEDWILSIKNIFEAYTRSILPTRIFNASDWRAFICKIKGGSTDHASDQMLLIELFTQWKRIVDRELRGEYYLRSRSPQELLKIIHDHLRMTSTANLNAQPLDWSQLPLDEQMRQLSQVWRDICVPFGEAAYQQLDPEDQLEVDSFVWAGCCMHKSLNAAKAGFEGMARAWERIPKSIGPVKMLNKDNADAAARATAVEHVRLLALARGGASKLTELMGMLLKHKDDKKGQQDVYKIAFEVSMITIRINQNT